MWSESEDLGFLFNGSLTLWRKASEKVSWTALEPKVAQDLALLLSKHWLAPVTANEALRAFRRCLHQILCDERVVDIVENQMAHHFGRACGATVAATHPGSPRDVANAVDALGRLRLRCEALLEALATFVPTQLEKFGPKDVVGVAVALGRLQERDDATLLALAGLATMDLHKYSVSQIAALLTAFARVRVREVAGEILDPAEFADGDASLEEVFSVAFGKLGVQKKSQAYPVPKDAAAAPKPKPAVAPAPTPPAEPAKPVAAVPPSREREELEGTCNTRPKVLQDTSRAGDAEAILAKLKAQKEQASPEQLEELLEARRRGFAAAAPVRCRGCAGCGKEGSQAQAFQCGTCKAARYCSYECQKSHWREHKKKCRKRVTANICVLSDFA
eukprot:s5_g6.t1